MPHDSFSYQITLINGYYYAILDGGEVIGAYLTVGALIADMRSIADHLEAGCAGGAK